MPKPENKSLQYEKPEYQSLIREELQMAFTKEQLATRLQKAKDRFAKDSSDKKATLAQQRETKKRMKRAARKYRSSVDFIDRREKRRAKDGE